MVATSNQSDPEDLPLIFWIPQEGTQYLGVLQYQWTQRMLSQLVGVKKKNMVVALTPTHPKEKIAM